MLRLVAFPLIVAVPALAQPGIPETVGSWIVACTSDPMTDRAECRMLHHRPAQPAAAGLPALSLEVEERGGHLVPLVAARDLTLEGAARGMLALTGTAQLRFPPNRFLEMPCGLEGRSLVCAPREEDGPRAAAELRAADRALIRIAGAFVPEAHGAREPVELALSGTAEALSRYRARRPADAAPAPPAALPGLRDLLSRLMGLLGPS